MAQYELTIQTALPEMSDGHGMRNLSSADEMSPERVGTRDVSPGDVEALVELLSDSSSAHSKLAPVTSIDPVTGPARLGVTAVMMFQ